MDLMEALERRLAGVGLRLPDRRQVGRAVRSLVTAPREASDAPSGLGPLVAALDEGRDVAAGFSPVATREDIVACFRLILGRNPNPEEWPGHSAQVGQALEPAVKGYLNSLEFSQRRLIGGRLGAVQRVQLEGYGMYVDTEDQAVGRHVAFARSYEPEVTREVLARLGPGMAFLDVGANMGFFTLLAASVVGEAGRVVAVEPNPRNVKLLQASVAMNGYRSVSVFQAAAASTWSTLVLNAVHSNGIVSPAPSELGDLIDRETVLALRLDDLPTGLSRLDLVKIDVEGAEYLALRGAEATLRRFRPTVISEFAPESIPGISGVTPEAYLAFLVDLGYQLSVITPEGLSPCGTDGARVIGLWRQARVDHIDLVAEHPRGPSAPGEG